MIRKPAVAGSFYPNNKKELSLLINNFLSQVKQRYGWDKKVPKIIISPHAGIYFSGLVAASGYKNLVEKDINTVILLGVSHNYLFDYASVFYGEAWETPLGKVRVNKGLIKKITDKNKKIVIDNSPHINEHTLEMQLVFLQKALKGKFNIVPLLISQVDYNLRDELVRSLSSELKKKGVLMVISTDLSHYPTRQVANYVDSVTIEKILAGEMEFYKWIEDGENTKLQYGVDTLTCGREAVLLGLGVAKSIGLDDVRYFRYMNSGDISGDNTRVVGYSSIGFYKGKQDYKIEALQLARRSLEFYLRTGGKKIEVQCKSKKLKEDGGAFVTLYKDGKLRGCIGEIVDRNKYCLSIQENAINAGVSDPRFYPVLSEELNSISIEVSLLSSLKEVSDWKKIRLGKDGVMVKQGINSGVFLPQVGKEIPNLENFLQILCSEKAGLSSNCYKDPLTKIYTFTADVFAE